MRLVHACLTALFLGLAALPAAAQEEPIQDTIQKQIDAFLRDDFLTAFGYASPNIRALFGTVDNFGLMVTRGYPMVHRPSAVEMGALREENGALYQRVQITDAAGRIHVLDYQMVETADGWKINGVELLQSVEAGV